MCVTLRKIDVFVHFAAPIFIIILCGAENKGLTFNL